MADPRDPIGEIIRNLILLQRLGNGLSADVTALIDELFDDIIAHIARIDPTAPAAERYRRARVEKVLGIIEEQTTETFDEVFRQVRQDVAEIGAQQATWAANMLETSIGGVAVDIRPGRLGVNMMKAIIDRDPMQGLLLRDWFTGQSDATIKRVRRQIQLGMMQNETLDDIVRRVRGRAVGRGNYVGGVLQTTTREATAIVRTAINDIANTAHMETWRENADIAPRYQIVATLDSRTTPICRARDGEVHNVEDEGAPRPPFHVGCRTVTVPLIDWQGLGIDPPEPGMRASANGPISAGTNYEEWLRGQSVATQEDILGKERARIFREQNVSLREMIRSDGTQIRVRDLNAGRLRSMDVGAGDDAAIEAEARRNAILPQVLQDEKEIVGKKWEYARAWNVNTGERIMFGGDWQGRNKKIEKTSGSPTQINFDSRELESLKDAILTHNHPNGSPFSVPDILTAARYDLAEIRAVGKVNTFSLRRPPGGWDVPAMEEAAKTIDAEYKELVKKNKHTLKEVHELLRRVLGSMYSVSKT